MQVLGSILRFLFAWIDGIVAKVITLVYNLLMDLANLTLYSENIVKVIGQRIGILLGIFMLFRLSVSLINYMISPERFSDNKQGGGALIKNIIISLVLLATVNTIFETAYSVQQKIVSSQIIEKIFFGETSQTKMDIGYYLYTGFFTPNLEVIPNCNEMWDPTFDLANSQCNQDLGGIVETNALNSIHDARNNLDMSQIFSNYDVVMANEGGAFKGKLLFNYTPIISTAAGVVTLLIMISFSMELAKRAIKLLFLQIVAPVPIIFNMDTGKGKDVFQKWYKQCFNTYISVFIRLLAIDFAVFIIVLLKGEFSNVFQDKLGVNIFIIIGCLLFAKEVPKLIEDMTGIKSDGMLLRPLKKFEDQALFGKNITGFAAGVGSGAMGAVSRGGAGRLFIDPFGRLISGKGFTETWKNQVSTNSRMRTARLNDSTFLGRRTAHLTSTLGLRTPTETDENRIKQIDKQLEVSDRQLELVNRKLQPIKDEMSVLDSLGNLKKEMEQRAESKILEGHTSMSKDIIEAQSKVDTLKASAGSLKQWVYDQGGNDADYQDELRKLNEKIAQATTEYNTKLKKAKEEYVEDVFQGTLTDEFGAHKDDAVLSSKVEDYNEKIRANSTYKSVRGLGRIGSTTTYDEFDKQDTTITNSNQTLKHSSYGLESMKQTIEDDQRTLREKKKDIQTSADYGRRQANKNAIGK